MPTRRDAFSVPAPPWGVIADDLTGATDVAAAFAKAGFRAVVLLDRRMRKELQADVFLLSSDSRHDSGKTAARKVINLARWLGNQRVPLFYKKMDSTLQGNIVAEVEALREGGGFDTALVCPANPAQDRLIKQGQLSVRGKKAGDILTHLQAQGLQDALGAFVPHRRSGLDRALGSARFILADAVTGRDLDSVIAAVFRVRRRVLLAGSAGLAAALASALRSRLLPPGGARRRTQPRASRAANSPVAGPLLMLCGSQNPVTRRQVEALISSTDAARVLLTSRAPKAVRLALTEGRAVVLNVPVHDEPDAVILKRLRTLSPMFREHLAGWLLLTGGDTARLACRWLRPAALTIGGEIQPGLAWGTVHGGLAHGLTLCSKPGGFGDDQSLVGLVNGFGLPPRPQCVL